MHELVGVTPDFGIEGAPAGVENPTTTQSRPPKRRDSPRPAPTKRSAMARPATTSLLPGAKGRPATIRTCGRRPGHRRQAPEDHVGRFGTAAAALAEGRSAPPTPSTPAGCRLPQGDFRQAFDDRRLVALDAALDFGSRRLADDHDVVGAAGGDEGLVEALDQHQHGEDEDHERHATGGEGRGQAPGPLGCAASRRGAGASSDRPQAFDDVDPRRPTGGQQGRQESHRQTAKELQAHGLGETRKTGKRLPMAAPKIWATGKVAAIPRTPPTGGDGQRFAENQRRDETRKPRALRAVAYSAVRSRTVIAMVLAGDRQDDGDRQMDTMRMATTMASVIDTKPS